MSNNSLSHPLSSLNQQGFQLEPIRGTNESSLQPMVMVPVGPESKNDGLQQVPLSNDEHVRAVEHPPYNHGLQKMSMTNLRTGRAEPRVNEFRPHQLMFPNDGLGGVESMYSLPRHTSQNKRKTSMVFVSSNQIEQPVTTPNKKMQVEHRPWMQQLSSPGIQNVPMQPISESPRQQYMPQLSNKVVLLDSIPKKAGPQKKTTPPPPSPKVSESFGPVRSKLVESLTAALALVSQQQDIPLTLKNNTSEPATSPRKSKETSSPTGLSGPHDNAQEKPLETMPSSEDSAAPNYNGCTVSQMTLSNENTIASPQNWKYDGPEFPLNPVMPEIDVSFGDNLFVKDDFLQGNGLTWAIDVDMGVEEENEMAIDKEQKLDVVATPKVQETPEIVAVKIETELFKLYGGVNKKYKEKGRSLLFNLKDRNNPELRERVMSGDIPPERLCSMTAEELASKELSEWRIAKAEELAQMVVLPDSDDLRRMVKKTHKGEVQVEYEQDDTISVEVSAGASTLPQIRPKSNKKSRPSLESDKIKENANAINESTNNADQNGQYTLTIPPNEEGDLMLDEFKDVNFLPAIVSLDEFMESLDSEPPFQNIPRDAAHDAGKTPSPSDKDQLEGETKFESSISSKERRDKSDDKTDETDGKGSKSLGESKSSAGHVEPASVPVIASKCEQIWEGSIQLNPSSVITVVGFFKSGDKTTTKDWASPMDIKGRVRLEAFEKFIRDLPMSRSRAIMITHFVLKEGSSSEEDYASLSEVTGSYLAEDRVGYAEPCEGVEIYICPAHVKTLEMFKKHLPKNHIDALDDDDGISNNKGLIGVVIWRKLQLQNRHHNSSKRSKPQAAAPVSVAAAHGNKSRSYSSGRGDDGVDDDDDLPPGFESGPPPVRDDDDLPEFTFSGNSNVPVVNRVNHNNSGNLSKPVVRQMRELVQRYGQPAANTKVEHGGIAIQTWKNDDDDDDMPEWRPQTVVRHQLNSTTQLPPPPPLQTFQQQALRPHTMTPQQYLGVANPHHQTYHSPQPLPTVLPGPPIWGTPPPPYGGSPR